MSYNKKNGDFHVYLNSSKVLCSPLTQMELADGWVQVLPKRIRNNESFHFNVYLSELPPHLWCRLREDFNGGYKLIKNYIYYYTVKKTYMDDMFLQLYKLINSNNPNRDRMMKLVNKLESNKMRGWLLIKAKDMCNSD
jgi:hypothetical protein